MLPLDDSNPLDDLADKIFRIGVENNILPPAFGDPENILELAGDAPARTKNANHFLVLIRDRKFIQRSDAPTHDDDRVARASKDQVSSGIARARVDNSIGKIDREAIFPHMFASRGGW